MADAPAGDGRAPPPGPPGNGHAAPEPLRVAADAAAAEGWGFVLDALGIPNQVEARDGAFVLWVPPADRARAQAALAAQDREANEPAVPVPPAPDHGRSLAGVAVAVVLAAFFVVAGGREAGDAGGWFRRGAAVAERIVGGEIWRAVTALTLHADAGHVFGNAAAALVFVSALGRWLGGGLALALTLLSGGLGNLAVAHAYGRAHSSVGASTATFGALGILGGLQLLRWLRGRRAPGARRRALSIVAACLGIFAMLGVGPRSDVLAHLFGLGAGLALGAAAGALIRRPLPFLAQLAVGLGAALMLAGAWSWAWAAPSPRAAAPQAVPAVVAAPGPVAPPATGSGPAAAGRPAPAAASPTRSADAVVPRSTLHVEAHSVPRARFPVIDFHQHVNDRLGDGKVAIPPANLVAMMDAANVRTIVVLTGPSGDSLDRLMEALVRPYPGRFVVFTEVDWTRVDEPGFGEAAAARLRDSVARGARGLKVRKNLGLGVRDRSGRLLAVDDARLDPIWRECGRLRIPVAIHSGDPEAFFQPVDARNERLDELASHPDWSFHGRDYPSLEAVLAARDRVFARHRDTVFVALHVGGWPENLDYVSRLLARNPNVHVELGARQAELGRQPRRARRLFLEHPDRILFGTDFRPSPGMYANHFRWLETADEYFPYHGYPEQGRWYIYGLDLPDPLLVKVYHRNAERLLARFAGGR